MRPSPHNIILMSILFLVVACSQSTGGWKDEREKLDHVFVFGNFRIFYTLQGQNALIDTSDKDRNSVPDIVEDIALQLQVADRLYRDVINLTDPFHSKRYGGTIKTIDVHILDSRHRGESGDAVIAYNYKKIKPPLPPGDSLTITLSRSMKTGNLTPAHELIHAYQNGYTMFKNRWFTEGTARWSEYAFKEGTGDERKLPDNGYDLNDLLTKTYDAKYFWNRLFHLCSGNDGTIELPADLRNSSYIGNREKIIQGNDLNGINLMRNLLENLDSYDDRAAADKGLDQFSWKESDQKSPDNNRYIVMALKKTILDAECASTDEVREFLHIVDLYLNNKIPQIDAGPDLTDKIENIGNPYAEVYKKADEIYARNIWDMKTYRGLLFIGGGNTYNIGPAPNAGPVPIFSYDPRTGKFRNEGKVDDEQINTFTVLNDILYIPGADATESHEFGNYYLRSENGMWWKMRNIPGGLHVFSMNSFDQRLMAGISTATGAAVAISENNGRSWQVLQIGSRQSTYALLVIGNQLYAMKQFVPERYRKKWPAQLRDEYYAIAQYTGNNCFISRPDLTEENIFPDIMLENQVKRITRSLQIGDKALYIGAYNFKTPIGMFLASSFARNAVTVRRINLPLAYTPRDFLIRGDTLYLLCTENINNGYLQKVIKTSIHDLNNYQVVFHFSTSAFVRSFEEIDGDFYFGLGCDINNPRKWSHEEISPDTGKILRIRKKNIQLQLQNVQ